MSSLYKAGLIKKKVRRSDGVETTVWVSPDEAKAPKDEKKPEENTSEKDPKAKDQPTATPSGEKQAPSAEIKSSTESLKVAKSAIDSGTPPHEVVASLGGSAADSKFMVSDWNSDVFEQGAIILRGSFYSLLDTNSEQQGRDLQRLQGRMVNAGAPKGSTPSKASAYIKKQLSNSDTETTKTAKAVAQVSQAMHDEEVTLYRGVSGEQAAAIRAAMLAGQPVHVATDTLSSFTEDPDRSEYFAGKGGVIIKTVVKRSSIVMSHRAFKELSAEKEVVVATAGGFHVNHEDIQLR
jgi:hypothetical protein